MQWISFAAFQTQVCILFSSLFFFSLSRSKVQKDKGQKAKGKKQIEKGKRMKNDKTCQDSNHKVFSALLFPISLYLLQIAAFQYDLRKHQVNPKELALICMHTKPQRRNPFLACTTCIPFPPPPFEIKSYTLLGSNPFFLFSFQEAECNQ